jgi:hypothetical protein
MFARLFLADLFIHGVGGARYDEVTDDVIRGFFAIEPPPFVVASMTLYLPLGAHVVSDEEIEAATDRVNRLAHNPDQLLDEVAFDSPAEADEARELARAKSELVAAIAAPDADKKALGLRIREVNEALATMLAPVRERFEADLESLRSQREAGDVLTARTYPFCFFSPAEVADKVG